MSEQAVELARSGDKRSARAQLLEEVRTEPTNDQSWYGLALCAPGPGDRRAYLELALVANPDNGEARRALNSLQNSLALPMLNIGCTLCGSALLFGLLGALIGPQTGNFDFAFAAAMAALLGGFGLLILLPIRKRLLSSVDVEQEKHRIQNALKRRTEIFAHQDEWGEPTCRLVYEGSVQPEMTDQMVRLAWGEPTDIDQVEVTAHYSKERWVYDKPRQSTDYVFLWDGVVTKIIQN